MKIMPLCSIHPNDGLSLVFRNCLFLFYMTHHVAPAAIPNSFLSDFFNCAPERIGVMVAEWYAFMENNVGIVVYLIHIAFLFQVY